MRRTAALPITYGSAFLLEAAFMRRNAMHLTTAPSNRVGSVHKANEAVASGDARTFDAEDQHLFAECDHVMDSDG